MRRALDPPPRITRSKNRLRTIGQPAKQMLNGECVPRTACEALAFLRPSRACHDRYVRRVSLRKAARQIERVDSFDWSRTWSLRLRFYVVNCDIDTGENCTRYAKIYLFFVIDR